MLVFNSLTANRTAAKWSKVKLFDRQQISSQVFSDLALFQHGSEFSTVCMKMFDRKYSIYSSVFKPKSSILTVEESSPLPADGEYARRSTEGAALNPPPGASLDTGL
jgi:hypothetical protein